MSSSAGADKDLGIATELAAQAEHIDDADYHLARMHRLLWDRGL